MTRALGTVAAVATATAGTVFAVALLADWIIGAAFAVHRLTTTNTKGWHWR